MSWLDKYQNSGIIEDNRGQWAHPGKITKINNNNITMKGVPYPVLGISDGGEMQVMQPNQDYKFKGNTVTEIPLAQDGKIITNPGEEYTKKHPPIYLNDPKDPRINQYTLEGNQFLYKNPESKLKIIYTDNPNDPRLKAYQDSLNLYNENKNYSERFKNLPDQFEKENELRNSSYFNDVFGNDKIKPVGLSYADGAPAYKKPEQEVIVRYRPKERLLTLPETSGLQVTDQSPEFDGQMRIPMNRGWDVIENVQPGLGGYTSKYKTFDKDRIDYLERKAQVDRNSSTGRMNFIQILPDYDLEGFNPNGVEGVGYQVLNPGGDEQKTKRQIREEKAAALKAKQKGKKGLSVTGWLGKYNK